MLALGLGGGPAAALLMTLPPVSLPSLAMLGRSFPTRMLVAIAGAVVGFGILGGAIARCWACADLLEPLSLREGLG